MKIALKEPYSVGDLAPDVTYSSVYITTFYVNGPSRSAIITYEVGELSDPTPDNPMGTWTKAPLVPAASLQLSNDQLYPFFMAQVLTGDGVDLSLWNQVERLLYSLIQQDQPRLAGEVV